MLQVLLLILVSPVAAQEAIEKVNGRCPMGTTEVLGTGYCRSISHNDPYKQPNDMSNRTNKITIKKLGAQCPSGYYEFAGSCNIVRSFRGSKETTDYDDNVIQKRGERCPYGYSEQLNTGYCKKI